MNIITTTIPIIITGTNQMGHPSTSALQRGDRVRFFTEQGANGKPKPGGRPELRITTYGQIGDFEPSAIEFEGLLDPSLLEDWEAKFSGAVALTITAVLKMDGDQPDRVTSGAQSWTPGAFIAYITNVVIEKIDTVSTPFTRTKKLVVNDGAVSVD